MKKALIALYGLMVLLYASAYGFSLAALLVPVPFVGLALLTTEGVSRVVGRKAGGSATDEDREKLFDDLANEVEGREDKKKREEWSLFSDDPTDPSSGGLYLTVMDDD